MNIIPTAHPAENVSPAAIDLPPTQPIDISHLLR